MSKINRSVKIRVSRLLQKNGYLPKSPSLAKEVSLFKLARRLRHEALVSLSNEAKVASTSSSKRLRRSQKSFSRILRERKEKRNKMILAGRWTFQRRASLGADNPAKVLPISAMIDTTKGSGQHLRKNVSSYTVSSFRTVNNSRFFYNFNQLLPGLHPLQRLLGLFMRKGKRSIAAKYLQSVMSGVKQHTKSGFITPSLAARSRAIRTQNIIAPLMLLLLQHITQSARPLFRSISYKVAATKVRVPMVNNIYKSYSLLFRDLKEAVNSSKELTRKKLYSRNSKANYSSAMAADTSKFLAEVLDGKGVLAKKRLESFKEASQNRANLRLRKK